MRIWDINPKYLCRKHLLGEHAELHAIWSIILNKKSGFKNHPEVKRWRGKLKALYKRHDLLVKEMKRREYNHFSPLDKKLAKGKEEQKVLIDSIKKQKAILEKRNCNCFQ